MFYPLPVDLKFTHPLKLNNASAFHALFGTHREGSVSRWTHHPSKRLPVKLKEVRQPGRSEHQHCADATPQQDHMYLC